jgi:thiamine biosynthesis lipoprotein
VTGSTFPQGRFVEQVMGLPVTLALRGRHTDDEQARCAWQDCLAVLREADRVFSTYRDESYVSRLGRGELTVDACPPEVAEVLALGERARVESGGAFDVRRPGPHGGLVLDPSGVVKGWAVQRAAAPLLALDDTDVCLSAGGDMVCHVASPDREPWSVGVEDPLDPTRVLAVVPVRRGAVATSGHAHRGHHVVDPRTGRPTDGPWRTVSVAAASCLAANTAATAALVLGADAPDWLVGLRLPARFVDRDGAVRTVAGWPAEARL